MVTPATAPTNAMTAAERRVWILRTMRAGLDCVEGVPESERAQIYYRLTLLSEDALERVFSDHQAIFGFARNLHRIRLALIRQGAIV